MDFGRLTAVGLTPIEPRRRADPQRPGVIDEERPDIRRTQGTQSVFGGDVLEPPVAERYVR